MAGDHDAVFDLTHTNVVTIHELARLRR